MSPPRRSWAEVDLSALRENLAWIRHRVGPAVKIMTVVKADAYGHGLKQIAALLMQSGTDLFGVANLVEAQAIRSVGKGWPILMLGACLPEEVDLAVRESVMCTISSLEEAQRFSAAAKKQNKLAQLHLKIDTGMGRLGVALAQAPELLQKFQELPALKLQGIYTHYAAVEDDPEFTARQKQIFQKALDNLIGSKSIPYIHANNSGGLLCEADAMHNTVRPGLLVYGVMPPGKRITKAEFTAHFRPALSWKCRVSLVKEIPKGTSLSYGRIFIAPKAMRVATLSAGYGDGFFRAGSNHAQVLIGGARCPIIGRITMDQMLADVSHVPGVNYGDEVVLIGSQGKSQVTAHDLAQWCGTVPWEILTNITYRVPRIYHGSSAS